LVGGQHANHGPEVMRTIFPPAGSLERPLAHRRRQRYQVPACRLTDQEHPGEVNGLLGGMGMDPADGTEHVLVTGWRGRTTDQPVVNRHGKEAEARPLPDLDGAVGAFRFPEPAATVDREDDGERTFAFGVSDVGQQARSLDSAIDHVLLHDDLRFLVSGTRLGWLASGFVLRAGDCGGKRHEDASKKADSDKERHRRLRRWRAWPGPWVSADAAFYPLSLDSKPVFLRRTLPGTSRICCCRPPSRMVAYQAFFDVRYQTVCMASPHWVGTTGGPARDCRSGPAGSRWRGLFPLSAGVSALFFVSRVGARGFEPPTSWSRN